MTSASELFNNRRYRLGRNPVELGGAFESCYSPDRFSHHNRRHHHHNPRRHRHDADGCDPLRRTPNQISRPSFPECDPVRLDQGSSSGGRQSVPGIINSENSISILNRERFGGSDRLPGDVLLARERLVERLRGVSSAARRQSNRVSLDIPDDDPTLHGNIRDSEYRQRLSGVINFHVDPFAALQETQNRPPGLTQDALACLHVEIFTNAENSNKGPTSRVSQECSICLENFLEGAELICLPCGHKFHSSCLNPWLMTCGACPNCRTGIIVTNSNRAVK